MPKYNAKAAKQPLAETATPLVVDTASFAAQHAQAIPEDTRDQPGNELSPAKPKFAPATAAELSGKKVEFRRVRHSIYLQPCRCPSTPTQVPDHPQIPVPQHRLTPLRNSWMALYAPVTEHMQLDMRMNLKSKKVRVWLYPLR